MSSPKIAAVLGGGISGLSTAYYIRKKFGDTVKPIIFEKSSRCGGWIQTTRQVDGIYYETGPRSFRPVGLSGLSALDLLEEIGLDNKVLYVTKSNPVSKNRWIFSKGQLVRLPTDLSMLFRKTAPFEKPLLASVLRDLVTPRFKGQDDSVYNFVQRRFGSDVAEYGIDPLIRGICAGDAQRISVKLTLDRPFEYEQLFGSVVLGYLVSRFRDKPTSIDEFLEIPGHKGIGMSKISVTSIKEGWALWGLENGTESLVERLQELLEQDTGVSVIRNSKVHSIQFADGENASSVQHPAIVQYEESDVSPSTMKSQPCDFVVSALPAWNLANILRNSKPSYPTLSQLVDSIEGTDVVVTNVLYRDPEILKEYGFGFLVPSNEVQNTPGVEGLLGVVFDSCVFDQGENTVLTLISKPPGGCGITSSQGSTAPAVVPTKESMEPLVKDYLKTTLGILREPDFINVKHSPMCIPQYTVGHSEKVGAARRFIKAAKIPLMLSGASFEGISVNDCIYSGRRASELLPFEEP